MLRIHYALIDIFFGITFAPFFFAAILVTFACFQSSSAISRRAPSSLLQQKNIVDPLSQDCLACVGCSGYDYDQLITTFQTHICFIIVTLLACSVKSMKVQQQSQLIGQNREASPCKQACGYASLFCPMYVVARYADK